MNWFKRSLPADDRLPADLAVDEKNIDGIEHSELGSPTREDADLAAFIDPAVEQRLRRKFDRRLVSLVFVLYLLAFLDRSNIGNARTAGLAEDLDLDSDRYEWLLTIFYIAYIVFEPGVVMWKLVPPHYWAAFVAFAWGVAATCQAAATSWAGLMVLRFIMAAAEAMFGPGTPFLLSFFYLRHELGLRCGIFLSAAPLASTFAGALAYGITDGHANLGGTKWRLLFLVEGLPSIAMAAVVFFLLPDSPATARFLTPDERKVAVARGVRQAGAAHRIGGLSLRDVKLTLLDLKAWLTAFMYFSCNVSFASLPVFLPTLLTQMGFTSINAQGLTAPPYFLAFLVTIGSTYIADRTQQRGLTITVLSLVGGIGYIIQVATANVGARYFGIFLVASGVFPAIANILPWTVNNQTSDTRRGVGLAILNIVGQCGPLLGTRVYPETDEPRYIKGHSICAAFMFFTTFLALSLRMLLAWENRQLDKRYGTLEEQHRRIEERKSRGGDDAAAELVGVENAGPLYRYVL